MCASIHTFMTDGTAQVQPSFSLDERTGARPKPFTPESLGERWRCSAEKVRQMFHSGELAGFRLGKLIRIPAVEVERFECAQLRSTENTSSSNTEESSQSR